jgi:hypothetical protein
LLPQVVPILDLDETARAIAGSDKEIGRVPPRLALVLEPDGDRL